MEYNILYKEVENYVNQGEYYQQRQRKENNGVASPFASE